MSVKFMEGFGHYRNGRIDLQNGADDFFLKWASYNGDLLGGLSSTFLEDRADGTKWMRLDSTTASQSIDLDTPSLGGITTIIVGMRLHAGSHPIDRTLFTIHDGASVIGDVRVLATTGTIEYRTGGVTQVSTANTALATGSDVDLEVKIVINDTTGSVEWWQNNVADGSDTGIDTLGSGTSATHLRMFGTFQNLKVTNVYIDDSTRHGAWSCKTLAPSADGTVTDWTPLGAATNEEEIDEIGDDADTSYNSSSTLGQQDRFTMATLSGADSVIAVNVIARAKKDTGAITLEMVAHDGTNEAKSAGKALQTSYRYVNHIFEAAPDAGAWTQTKVNNTQFGYELA